MMLGLNLGVLPQAPSSRNGDAADICEGQLFAYGFGAGVAVVDVNACSLACVLLGGHGRAHVTAVKWSPGCHARGSSAAGELRLASGDDAGGVVVWAVRHSAVVARLDEAAPLAAAEAGRERRGDVPGAVSALAWVLPEPGCVLAVLLAPGTLLLWDTRVGSVLWRRDLGGTAGEPFSRLAVDPLDCRRVAATGSAGALLLLTLPSREALEAAAGQGQPSAKAVPLDSKQYRVTGRAAEGAGGPGSSSSSSSGGGAGAEPSSLAAPEVAFSAVRDLLAVLLPAELLLFDLELGAPVGGAKLLAAGGGVAGAGTGAGGRQRPAAFAKLLALHGASGCSSGAGMDGGADLAVCSHVDGSISTWARGPQGLSFVLVAQAGQPGSSGRQQQAQQGKGPAAHLPLMMAAQVCASLKLQEASSSCSAMAAAQGPPAEAALSAHLAQLLLPGRPPDTSSSGSGQWHAGSNGSNGSLPAPTPAGPAPGFPPAALQPQLQLHRTLLVIAVTAGGSIAQWQMQLPSTQHEPPRPWAAAPIAMAAGNQRHSSAPASVPPPPALPPPLRLVALLHTLRHPLTTLAVFPQPLPAAALLGGADLPAGPRSSQGGWASWRDQGKLLLGAAASSGGTLEVFTLRQGVSSPCRLDLLASLAPHGGQRVRGLRWLPPASAAGSPRLVSFSLERHTHGCRNTILITDTATGASVPLRPADVEPATLIGMRASPSGAYLLLLFERGSCELWAVAEHVRPARLTSLELPFSAIEWVLPPASHGGPASPTGTPPLGPSPGKASLTVVSPLGASPLQSAAAAASPGGEAASPATLPEERLAFTLSDGTPGVLQVRGKRLWELPSRAPVSSGLLAAPPNTVASAIAGYGGLVVLANLEGQLLVWEPASGRHTSMAAAGQGLVRRLHLLPLPHAPSAAGRPAAIAQVVALHRDHSWGVYRLAAERQGEVPRLQLLATSAPAPGALVPGPAGPAAGGVNPSGGGTPDSLGIVRPVDLAWLPLPLPVGLEGTGEEEAAGFPPYQPAPALALVTQEGSLVVVQPPWMDDGGGGGGGGSNASWASAQEQAGPAMSPVAAASRAVRPLPGRPALLGLNGLAAPKPLGTCLLLPPAWTRLLRLLLQAGASQAALLYVGSSRGGEEGEEAEVAADLGRLLPQGWVQRVAAALAETQEGGAAAGQQAHATGVPNAPRKAAGSLSGAGAGTPGSSQRSGPGPAALMASMRAGLATGLSSLVGRRQGSHAVAGGSGGGPESCSASGPRPLGGLRSEAELLELLTLLARMRGDGRLLLPGEWHAYCSALASGSVAGRMCVAASVAGDEAEALFWAHLPATLAAVGELMGSMVRQQMAATPPHLPVATPSAPGRPVAAAAHTVITGRPSEDHGGAGHLPSAALPQGQPGGGGGALRLWDERVVLSAAAQRVAWHEGLARGLWEASALQERRMLEYCVLGDYATSVALLLASEPEPSGRYYRDAVCALALATAATMAAPGATFGRPPGSLQAQAAKVIGAQAASVGDALLGVPLDCAAGLYADAVAVLQDAGLWRYAAVLIARTLSGAERAAALLRWALHVLSKEGSLWRAAGLLVAGGCCRTALQLLREAGLPDSAAAFLAACRAAGLLTSCALPLADPQGSMLLEGPDAGHPGAMGRQGSAGRGHAQAQAQAVELFDLLAGHSRLSSGLMAAAAAWRRVSSTAQAGLLPSPPRMDASTTAAGSAGMSSAELCAAVEAEFERWVVEAVLSSC